MTDNTEDSANADTVEHVNTDRENDDLNEQKENVPNLEFIEPVRESSSEDSSQEDRSDSSVDESTTSRQERCGRKWCPVCGPRKRLRMRTDFTSQFHSKEGLIWAETTLDKEVQEAHNEQQQNLARKRWRTPYQWLRRKCSDLSYVVAFHQGGGSPATLQMVLSAPGLDVEDIREYWFNHDGAAESYTEKIETREQLNQRLGHLLRCHFEEVRRARRQSNLYPKLRTSQDILLEDEEAAGSSSRAQKADDASGALVSFASEKEYLSWLSQHIDEAENRRVRVGGYDQLGTAIRCEQGEVVVRFPNETTARVSPIDVLPVGIKCLYFDQYTGTSVDGTQAVYCDTASGSVQREAIEDTSPLDAHVNVAPSLRCPVMSGWEERTEAPKSQDLDEEIWRPVVGFEGVYSVSNMGRVRRDDTGRVLSPYLAGRGYPAVDLSRGHERTKCQIHFLVAKAFLGDPPGQRGQKPGDYQVNHINGRKEDNRPSNLEWTTTAENVKHEHETGLCDNSGENHGCSAFSRREAEKVRRLYKETEVTYADLGERFGVHEVTIGQVVRGETYKPEN